MKYLIALLVVSGVAAAFGQQQGSSNPMLLDPKLPSVTLRIAHTGNRTPVYIGESHHGTWLRLRNNTKGAISVCTESFYVGSKVSPLKLWSGKDVLGLRDGTEVAVCYEVGVQRILNGASSQQGVVSMDRTTEFQKLPFGSSGNISSTSWIPSGSSVFISVPEEHLLEGYRISVPFNYDWESNSQHEAHIAFFPASDLPKSRDR